MERLRNPIPDTNFLNNEGRPFEERYIGVNTEEEIFTIFQDAYCFLTDGGVLSERDFHASQEVANRSLSGGVSSARDMFDEMHQVRTRLRKDLKEVTVTVHTNSLTAEVIKIDRSGLNQISSVV